GVGSGGGGGGGGGDGAELSAARRAQAALSISPLVPGQRSASAAERSSSIDGESYDGGGVGGRASGDGGSHRSAAKDAGGEHASDSGSNGGGGGDKSLSRVARGSTPGGGGQRNWESADYWGRESESGAAVVAAAVPPSVVGEPQQRGESGGTDADFGAKEGEEEGDARSLTLSEALDMAGGSSSEEEGGAGEGAGPRRWRRWRGH
ncbi:unnamed protein product, partial [Phaeothamnion confervicola]